MGRARGRKQERNLPDLGIYPRDDCYRPPPGEGTETTTYSLQLTAGNRAGVVQTFREGTTEVVSFSVWQAIHVDGEWFDIMRIDTWHGSVHRHDYTRAGSNQRTVLEVIPTDHAETVIGHWCDRAEDIIMTEWEDNVRRWHGDPE